MSEEKIRSESEFIWKTIGKILLTPIYFIMFLFKKKTFNELIEPFTDFLKFIFEPKFTIGIISITTIITFYSWIYLPEKSFNLLMNYPLDIFDFSRYYSLISSGFIHSNIAHLSGNMLATYLFGRVVEKKLGGLKMLGIYFSALIISSFGSSLINFLAGNNIPSLGASGAIMGLVSAAILLDPFFFTYEYLIPMPVMVAGWITIYSDFSGIISKVDDGIGHFAHIFGFLSISLTLYFFGNEDKEKIKKGFWINIASITIISIIYFIVIKRYII